MCSWGARQPYMNRRDLCFLQMLLLNSWVGAGAKVAGSEAGSDWRLLTFESLPTPLKALSLAEMSPRYVVWHKTPFSICPAYFPSQHPGPVISTALQIHCCFPLYARVTTFSASWGSCPPHTVITHSIKAVSNPPSQPFFSWPFAMTS